MGHSPLSDCVGALLDALCYELVGGRLSAEIVCVLQDHLRECASCRRSMRGYIDLLKHDTPTPRQGGPILLLSPSKSIH